MICMNLELSSVVTIRLQKHSNCTDENRAAPGRNPTAKQRANRGMQKPKERRDKAMATPYFVCDICGELFDRITEQAICEGEVCVDCNIEFLANIKRQSE
jgi:hypothetical protein